MVVDEELNKKPAMFSIRFISVFTVLARWVDIVATRNKGLQYKKKALALRFAKVAPQRLYFDDYPKTTTRALRVPVMENYKINFLSQTSIGLERVVLGKVHS